MIGCAQLTPIQHEHIARNSLGACAVASMRNWDALCSEFSMVECIYSFASKDTKSYVWIDSSVDLSDNNESQYFKLLKFIRAKIQTTNIGNKEAIAKDLTKLTEFNNVKLLDSKSFCDAYESMLNQKSKD